MGTCLCMLIIGTCRSKEGLMVELKWEDVGKFNLIVLYSKAILKTWTLLLGFEACE